MVMMTNARVMTILLSFKNIVLYLYCDSGGDSDGDDDNKEWGQ